MFESPNFPSLPGGPVRSNALVSHPDAVEFISAASTPVGRRAFCGDDNKFEGAKNWPRVAAEELEKAVDIVKRLPADANRTEPNKHEAARAIYRKLNATLADCQSGILKEAEKLSKTSEEMVVDRFALDNSKSFSNEMMVKWLADKASKPNGGFEIARRLGQDKQLATVFFNTRPWLMNMTDKTYNRMLGRVIGKHAPDAMELETRADGYRKLAAKYPGLQRRARLSFYNEEMAETSAKTRVELD